MIILYWKDVPDIQECTFNQAIPLYMEVIDRDNKLYLKDRINPIINDSKKVGWFAVPEQHIPSPIMDDKCDPPIEIPRTIQELNLFYFESGEHENLQRNLYIEIDNLKNRIETLENKIVAIRSL